MAIQDLSGRHAARARREAQVHGKAALPPKPGIKASSVARTAAPSPVATQAAVSSVVGAVTLASNSGRNASRARRQALSQQGKGAVAAVDRQRRAEATGNERKATSTQACSCDGNGQSAGDDLIRSTALMAVVQPRRNEIKVVTPSSAGRINSRLRREALAAHGKTGVDAYRKGISSAQMVRHQNPDISGRELARTVRTQRSSCGGVQNSGRSAPAGRRRPERLANAVSGTKVAHSEKMTGDELGLCRVVTGTEYLSSDIFAEFCQKEPPSVPRKVESSENLSGGVITASGKVGRSDNVTGNERGSCRIVTGVEYVGREHYDDFCKNKPEPGSAKVSFSQTTRGQIVSGSKPARARQVTGNEAGSCQAITGTPYAAVEQLRDYCEPSDAQRVIARTPPPPANVGRDITGLQPGFAGLTGAGKGACQEVSGTAYIGAEQQQEVCPAVAGRQPDAPPPPVSGFSIVPPSRATQSPAQNRRESVTGTRYEQGRISGTFSLGEGKITGTEQFRFGDSKTRSAAPSVQVAEEMKVSRVTGEGLDIGLKITGNDWNRGERVTGTEGVSAAKRNPTRRGPISAMPTSVPKRNEEIERSDIKVTGGSGGNSDKGAPVTLSGGARG
ncbi:MAG: carboxysome shell protein CsoS2 [Halothiobacillaceae bacterium]|nr:MAG: carboxysome shell protein CsoS2 [Halothiobacillaceae bacterium]